MAQEEAPRLRTRPNGSAGNQIPSATMFVTRSAYGGPEAVTEELVEVPRFHGPVARVRVEGGVTMNMGDYQSSRVTVSVDLPCYAEASEIQRIGDIASGIVSRRIGVEAAKIKEMF